MTDINARVHLSFVLLPQPYDVDGAAIVTAFARLFPGVPRPLVASSDGKIAELRSSDGMTSMIALMPAPVPAREADMAAERSLAAMTENGVPNMEHAAQLIVTSSGGATVPALVAHTRIAAACADAYGAVGVYEGNACATHPTAFYLDVVTSMDPPVMVWTGISVAHMPSARTEILTLGIERMIGLPDLLISVRKGAANDALSFLFDMLSYIIGRGQPLPDGDTIGRSAEEKLRVRYVPSPVDASKSVVRIDLP